MNKCYLHPMFNIDALEIINKFKEFRKADFGSHESYPIEGFLEGKDGQGGHLEWNISELSIEQRRATAILWLIHRVAVPAIEQFRREILIPMYPHLNWELIGSGINTIDISHILNSMSKDAKIIQVSTTPRPWGYRSSHSERYGRPEFENICSPTPFTPQMNFMNWLGENPLEVKE